MNELRPLIIDTYDKVCRIEKDVREIKELLKRKGFY